MGVRNHINAVANQLYIVLYYALVASNIVFLLELFSLDYGWLMWISDIMIWVQILVAEDPILFDYTTSVLVVAFLFSILGFYGTKYAILPALITNSSSKDTVYIFGFLYHFFAKLLMIFRHRIAILGFFIVFLEVLLKIL